MSACPDKLLLLHGFVDGELDAANSLALEEHLRTCPGCADELSRIEAVRARLGACDLAWRAPPALVERIMRDISATTPVAPPVVAPARRRRIVAAALTSLAAGLAVMLAVPALLMQGTQDELVASHVRSLLAGHLTDVTTSDQHLVKPWFNGRIDFAPPVPELARDGFPLAGGRLDYVDQRVIAAIVYHRRLHTINLFVRPAGTLALPLAITTHREGYNIVRWTQSGLEFWAVSDLNTKELQQFRDLFVRNSA